MADAGQKTVQKTKEMSDILRLESLVTKEELSEAIFVFVKVNWLLWTDLDAEHKTHRSAVPGT